MKCEGEWYEYNPEPVVENSGAKILWDLTTHTGKRLQQIKKVCYVIDVACPGDSRILSKEEEKLRSTKTLHIRSSPFG